MANVDADLAILGGGPGGYVAAIRASQLGMRTVLVEREAIGGVCLNWGCIPAKSLLRSAEVLALVRRASEFGVEVDGVRGRFDAAMDRSDEVVRRVVRGVQYLLERHGVTVLRGEGVLTSAREVAVQPAGDRVRAARVIVATGGRPFSPWPVDGSLVMTSRDAFARRELPRRVVIIGGGCVGVEFAEVYAAFGAKVTLIERSPTLLDGFDEDALLVLQRSLEERGVDVRCATSAEAVRPAASSVTVDLAGPGGTTSVDADATLVALGIAPNSGGIGLEEVGVERDTRGFILTDERGETSVPGVYAAGDITGRLPLAHVAFAQGTLAVEAIAGLAPRPLDYEAIPRAVYTHPQVASIGLSEGEARARGHDVTVGRFPFSASGAAVALGLREGMVKLVIDRSNEILGCHMVGAEVTELIHEVALGRTLETTPLEIVGTVHAHPTLAEVIREAALALTSGAIHYYRGAVRGD